MSSTSMTTTIGYCSRDPIGYKAGPNLFQFLVSSPFKYVDPSGFFESKAECDKAIRGKRSPDQNGFAWPKNCVPPDVSCDDCAGGDPDSGGRTEPNGGNKYLPAKIKVCWKKATSDNIGRILRHKFVHALDSCNCHKKIDTHDWSETFEDYQDDQACTEIRAYSLDGGCDNKATDAERKECIVENSAQSIKKRLGCTEDEALAIARRTIDQCYLPKFGKPPFAVPAWPRPNW